MDCGMRPEADCGLSNGGKEMSKSDLGLRRAAPAVWRYGLSALSVAISTAVTIPLQSFGVQTSLFFPAVLLST
jgi:hypothetical protein